MNRVAGKGGCSREEAGRCGAGGLQAFTRRLRLWASCGRQDGTSLLGHGPTLNPKPTSLRPHWLASVPLPSSYRCRLYKVSARYPTPLAKYVGLTGSGGRLHTLTLSLSSQSRSWKCFVRHTLSFSASRLRSSATLLCPTTTVSVWVPE